MPTMDYDSFEESDSPKSKGSKNDNDEETDDASETDRTKTEEESIEIKEQMYRVKLAQIKKQLAQLKNGTLHEYNKRLKKLQTAQKERHKQISVWHNYLLSMVEQEYEKDKQAAIDELKVKKIDLKENLILELQEKQKNIESERLNMELTGACPSSTEVKTITRKLRRRPNDPLPTNNDKRRKPSPTQINFMISEDEINDDLKLLNNGKFVQVKSESNESALQIGGVNFDVRIESGKLLYNKKWFHRGQPIYAHQQKENIKMCAVISSISDREVWIKNIADGSKIRLILSQLTKGKYTITRRSMQ